MKLSSLSCVICLAAIAVGEESQHQHPHLNINQSTSEPLVTKHDDHDHDHSGHDHHDHKEDHNPDDIESSEVDNPARDYVTWLAAGGSITLISLCGVFGILVVPIMQRVLYQHLIQFLIALAVGTLTGDALLHLLPHAFLTVLTEGGAHSDHTDHSEHHNHRQHQQAVWLGFVAAMSMIGFFIFEKIVNVIGEMREKKGDDKKLRVVREGHVVSDKVVGDAVCKNKYSSYCANDLDIERDGMMNQSNTTSTLVDNSSTDTRETVIITQHEVHHHGHSHAHSHLHSAPKNISSVAWMVIFGDGIHNLADGLAIGAAFGDGYMSGFSTSIAVLCHELPHEIGDFAMLLKAGMTIKQAVFYNILSSVLACVGMIIGLLLGSLHTFSAWIFTATAGIFLYVALVDMMPELSSGHAHPISPNKQKEAHWLGLTLQVLGMFSGVFIMLAIAIYEHELKNAFS